MDYFVNIIDFLPGVNDQSKGIYKFPEESMDLLLYLDPHVAIKYFNLVLEMIQHLAT